MLFCDLQTQWRTGMAGITGLDYAVLPAVFRLRGIKRSEQQSLFDDLRTMEITTLRLASIEGNKK